MGLTSTAWKAWRAKRKYKKEVKKMSTANDTKTVLTSRTTQNVAAATVTTGGTVAGILAGARAVFPDLIPWDESADVSVTVVLTTVIVPLVSRVIAFWRTPEKKAATTE